MPESQIAAARRVFPVCDYDLAATLNSGQAFRWTAAGEGWSGVIGRRWVRLQLAAGAITAETALPVADWIWLASYLQLDANWAEITGTFPNDAPMAAAVRACRGLRLLRQDPWECLATFILSSTKQIVQIRQIVAILCARYGEVLPAPGNHPAARSFPSAPVVAALTETDLRACRMGFRAPSLLGAARAVASGELDLGALAGRPTSEARERLMRLRGVGRKIADCALLFAYGRQDAFPVDVWVMRALRELYFSRREVNLERLREFAATHFGPYAGYAQQYLFHYRRMRERGA